MHLKNISKNFHVEVDAWKQNMGSISTIDEILIGLSKVVPNPLEYNNTILRNFITLHGIRL